MSAFFSWQQAILKSELEPTTRLVFLTIGCHVAMDGSGCFPSYAIIVAESGLNRATVIKHVQKAADAGFLAVEGRFLTGADGKVESTSNRYRPFMPQVVANDNHPSRPAQPPLVAQGDPNTPSLTPQVTTPPTPKGEPDGFAGFWSAYPNKVGKPKAMAVWKRIKAGRADVMAGLRRWKASAQWTKDKGAFIPHPTTWLNREGWNDVIAGETVPVSAEQVEKQKVETARIVADRNAIFASAQRRRFEELTGKPFDDGICTNGVEGRDEPVPTRPLPKSENTSDSL